MQHSWWHCTCVIKEQELEEVLQSVGQSCEVKLFFGVLILQCFCFRRRVHAATATTATSTLCPATCWTLSSMRTPAQALAQPHQGPWAQGPMAVGLQRVGRPTAGHLRAGRQAAEARPAGPPAVEQVCFNILSVMLRNVVRNVPYFVPLSFGRKSLCSIC